MRSNTIDLIYQWLLSAEITPDLLPTWKRLFISVTIYYKLSKLFDDAEYDLVVSRGNEIGIDLTDVTVDKFLKIYKMVGYE